ncbi:MAG: hypothetical protein ACOYON_02850 [Fimbriimonas sp.]
MRREWSAWIRAREWSEFERLAKKEPDQQLADTVGELERGLETKADRRALKKILYLLEQKGFVPSEIEEYATDDKPREVVFEVGLMVTSDAQGDGVTTYARQEGNKVRWLTTYIHAINGITHASRKETTLDEARKATAELLHKVPAPYLCVGIAPAYARARIQSAIRNTKSLPQAIIFNRSLLGDEIEMPHPGEGLARLPADPETIRKFAIEVEAALPWRLELGMAAPVLKELHEAQQSTEELTAEERRAQSEAILDRGRAALFTESVRADHESRLLDLALAQKIKGHDEASGLTMSVLDDFRATGPASGYARGLTDKSLFLLIEAYRKKASEDQTGKA